MIKNTLSIKKGFKFELSWIYHLVLALGFGLCEDQRVLVLLPLHLYFVYQKGMKEYISFILFLISSAFIRDASYSFVYFVLSLSVLLCGKLYNYFKWTLRKYFFIYTAVLLFLASRFLYADSKQVYILTGMGLVLSYVFTYMIKKEEEKQEGFFMLITILYFYLLFYFSSYANYIQITYCLGIVFYLRLNVVLMVLIYFTSLQFSPFYGFYLIVLSNNRSQRLFLSLLSWLFLFQSFDLETIYFASLCSLMGMLSYEYMDSFMETNTIVEREHQMHMEHSLYRQIVNYSTVFYDLSHYYEDLSEELSLILKRMGEAMEYNARVSKKYIYQKRELTERIKELLHGYQFSILNCEVETSKNAISIIMEVEHLYEGEVEDVILPLLEKVCESSLSVTYTKSYPLQKGRYRIVLESDEYVKVSTYGNGIHVHEISGDSYHSFSMDTHVVLMLSDGMGMGSKAKKTSSLLIQIMEALLRCQIPQQECVKMMNLFLQSDIYATLDLLCIDRRANKAYLSKSASAPTYLLRDNELYEMSARSLPIGIVDHISADVFEIVLQKGDLFVMCSDGIGKEEIERWFALKRSNTLKSDGLNFMNILKDKERRDDSSFLLAKID